MKSNKHLTHLSVFWYALLIPIGIAIIFAIVIINNSALYFDLSYLGFNKAINIFRVPLSIAALSFPLVALVATNHRSRQSSKQILLATEQNSFANYYKHKEEFQKILLNLERNWDIYFFDSTKLYEAIFPHNTVLFLSTNALSEKNKTSVLKDYLEEYISIGVRTQNYNTNTNIEKIYFDLFLLSDVSLKFRINKKEGTKLPFGNEYQKDYIIAYNNSDVLRHGTIIKKVLIELYNFSGIQDTLPNSYPAETTLFKVSAKNKFTTF